MSVGAISASDPHPRRRVAVLDSEIAYVDVGAGDPIVLLHGNPTSSYLWRNVIPRLEGRGRCLAPDLIGMGESGKAPAGGYRFGDHVRYLDAWFDAMDLGGRVTLVLHDWGSALGFYWARRHPERVRAIAYMEAIVRPIEWSEMRGPTRGIFEALRSPKGEEMVLDQNFFVERVLPGAIMRELADAEMAAYRKPFLEPGEARRPTLTWPREIPLSGEPADVVAVVRDYADWLMQSETPKLFINADPGAILVGPQRDFCRAFPNQEEVTVAGIHFVQEDSPEAIGDAIAEFLARH